MILVHWKNDWSCHDFPSPISSREDLIGDYPYILGINLIEPEIFGEASGILKGDPLRSQHMSDTQGYLATDIAIEWHRYSMI